MKSSPIKTKISKIRAKVFATVCGMLALLFLLIAVFSSPTLFYAFSYRTYQNLTTISEEINKISPGSITYLFELQTISLNNNITFEIVNSENMVSYSTMENASSVDFATGALPEYLSMLETNAYRYNIKKDNFEIRQKPATSAYYYILSKTLDTGETLYIYSSVADVESIVFVAGQVFSLISILTFILFTAVFYFLIHRLTKPLVEMSEITKDMAELNFSRKCGDYGNDEIALLGRNINILSDTLDATLIDLKDKNGLLEKDIENRLALDKARTSFINNVSHELKTPIAIISGYAEGVCEGISNDPQVIREYCQIINEESRKMNSLVVELLELSKLESKVQPFTPDYFDIGALVGSLLNHLALQFEQKDITIINNVPGSLSCYAQMDKIEIVLKNYITNAVSHCSGENIIEISCHEYDSSIEISVFNTGENIAAVDIPELWDSFYRADKSHARSENRFGLGLSIVKSIMTNHKCKYGVENTENGVRFTFEVAKDADYYEQKQD